ncbi:MAG: PQQ-binding-like beta-propeller repeat protein [Actinomycetota bacterium]
MITSRDLITRSRVNESGETNSTLWAINLKNGQVSWKYSLEGYRGSNKSADEYSVNIFGVAYFDGVIAVSTNEGGMNHLVGLDEDNGKLLWAIDAPYRRKPPVDAKETSSGNYLWWTLDSPRFQSRLFTSNRGTIVAIGGDNRLLRLDFKSGQILNTFTTDIDLGSVKQILLQGELIVLVTVNSLYCLDSAGKRLWSVPREEHLVAASRLSTVISGDYLVDLSWRSSDASSEDVPVVLQGILLDSGSVAWTRTFAGKRWYTGGVPFAGSSCLAAFTDGNSSYVIYDDVPCMTDNASIVGNLLVLDASNGETARFGDKLAVLPIRQPVLFEYERRELPLRIFTSEDMKISLERSDAPPIVLLPSLDPGFISAFDFDRNLLVMKMYMEDNIVGMIATKDSLLLYLDNGNVQSYFLRYQTD